MYLTSTLHFFKGTKDDYYLALRTSWAPSYKCICFVRGKASPLEVRTEERCNDSIAVIGLGIESMLEPGVLNLALLIPEKTSGNAFSRNPEFL